MRGPVVEQIKLPGTVITPEAGGGRPVQGATGTQAPAPTEPVKQAETLVTLPAPAPTRPVITIVAAPGIAPIKSVMTAPAMRPMDVGPEVDVEMEAVAPTVAPAPVKPSSKLPLYVGIGLLVYLLARK